VTRVEATQPEPRAAPRELEAVRAFVNSLDIEAGTDDLGDPRALGDWLVAAGLLDQRAADGLGPEDLRAAVALREALRAVLLAHAGEDLDEGALTVLNAAGARAPLVVRFVDGTDVDLVPVASGIDEALGRLLAGVERAIVDGTWARLKACRWDTCHWAFYDGSKNRSGSWCSMAVCGNRAKAAAYRRRQRAGPGRD
jgi:predicted RNA-binding Zn ribbon-like protein